MEEQETLSLGEKSLRYVGFSEEEDFDWQTDADVIVRHRPSLAVYCNAEGSIVVRQHHDSGDDRYIVIRKEDAKKIAKAIVDATNGQG